MKVLIFTTYRSAPGRDLGKNLASSDTIFGSAKRKGISSHWREEKPASDKQSELSAAKVSHKGCLALILADLLLLLLLLLASSPLLLLLSLPFCAAYLRGSQAR